MAQSPLYLIYTFYKFVTLDDFESLQPSLLSLCQSLDIKGSILLAQEGINGTVAGLQENMDALMDALRQDPRFADLEYKTSTSDFQPFQRMKVRLKQEIVRLGVASVDPNKQVGTYVDPQHWNDLITQDDVILIDTRNAYETRIGTFQGAIDPETETFREFPEYVKKHLDKTKHKKVAMFCTGGIRCEKASSFMLEEGFEEVYHLKGGILKYLEHIEQDDSLWEGECFVFDDRVSVVHGLSKGQYAMCFGCGEPILETDKADPKYEAGVTCPRCFDERSELQKSKSRMRWQQMQQAKK